MRLRVRKVAQEGSRKEREERLKVGRKGGRGGHSTLVYGGFLKLTTEQD